MGKYEKIIDGFTDYLLKKMRDNENKSLKERNRIADEWAAVHLGKKKTRRNMEDEFFNSFLDMKESKCAKCGNESEEFISTGDGFICLQCQELEISTPKNPNWDGKWNGELEPC